jgi:hypothetical protein
MPRLAAAPINADEAGLREPFQRLIPVREILTHLGAGERINHSDALVDALDLPR